MLKKWMGLALGLVLGLGTMAQELKTLPQGTLKTLDGKTMEVSELVTGKPVVISFWATWCSPCKRELNTIAEVYEDWQEETGVTLVAISIDDSRTASRVKPYINGQNWDYTVLLDGNSDFRRSMGVNNVPHTFLLNGKGEIVYQHNNFAPGDEDELYDKILELEN
jgi:cytochrome c biogenesis protein CcmG/thiol:disulfide interchange protein DsbE